MHRKAARLTRVLILCLASGALDGRGVQHAACHWVRPPDRRSAGRADPDEHLRALVQCPARAGVLGHDGLLLPLSRHAGLQRWLPAVWADLFCLAGDGPGPVPVHRDGRRHPARRWLRSRLRVRAKRHGPAVPVGGVRRGDVHPQPQHLPAVCPPADLERGAGAGCRVAGGTNHAGAGGCQVGRRHRLGRSLRGPGGGLAADGVLHGLAAGLLCSAAGGGHRRGGPGDAASRRRHPTPGMAGRRGHRRDLRHRRRAVPGALPAQGPGERDARVRRGARVPAHAARDRAGRTGEPAVRLV